MDSMSEWVLSFGFPTYLVGGAVRDEIMRRPSRDSDYVVIAPPEEIKRAVFAKGGVAHDLTVRDRLVGVRAYRDGVGVAEIAPPRVERSTGPGRHDFVIEPHPGIETGASVEEMLAADALRRDFTFNALYRDLNVGHNSILDPTGQGVADTLDRALRVTHADSFRDDPIRILRGARFVSQLGAKPTEWTLGEMRKHAGAVTALTRRGVSGTVRGELDKLLMGDRPGHALRLLCDTGVLGFLFPEWLPSIGYDQESRYHDLPLHEHVFRVVDGLAEVGASIEARLAALWHDVAKSLVAERGADGRLHFLGHEKRGAEIVRERLTALGYPTAIVEHVAQVVFEHMLRATAKPTPVKARKLRARMSDAVLWDVIEHRRADIGAKDGAKAEDAQSLYVLAGMIALEDARRAPRSRAELAITGADLIEVGFEPGRVLGEVLDELLHAVVCQPKLNRREWLLTQAGLRLRRLQAGRVPA